MNVRKMAPVIHMLHVLTQKALMCACVMKDTLEMAHIVQVKRKVYNVLLNLSPLYTLSMFAQQKDHYRW